jgi:hypothetical protein
MPFYSCVASSSCRFLGWPFFFLVGPQAVAQSDQPLLPQKWDMNGEELDAEAGQVAPPPC